MLLTDSFKNTFFFGPSQPQKFENNTFFGLTHLYYYTKVNKWVKVSLQRVSLEKVVQSSWKSKKVAKHYFWPPSMIKSEIRDFNEVKKNPFAHRLLRHKAGVTQLFYIWNTFWQTLTPKCSTWFQIVKEQLKKVI